MSLYRDLLFLHGHIADPQLAAELSAARATEPGPAAGATSALSKTSNLPSAWRDPMTLFKSLLYLGGLESIDSRIGEEEESFGPTYGNRVASERTFGKRAPDRLHRRVLPVARNPSVPLGCVGGACG